MLKNFIRGKIKTKNEYKKSKKGVCGICNEEGICFYDVFSSNFNNRDEVSSDGICTDCLPLFNEDYRKKSFYITETEAKLIQQKDIYSILHSITFPCILSFTASNKKHRLFRSKISYAKEKVIVVLDNGYVEFNLINDLELLHTIKQFYSSEKVSKERILTGNYPVGAIKKIGLEKFVEFENKIKKHRGTDKLKYLLIFSNKDG